MRPTAAKDPPQNAHSLLDSCGATAKGLTCSSRLVRDAPCTPARLRPACPPARAFRRRPSRPSPWAAPSAAPSAPPHLHPPAASPTEFPSPAWRGSAALPHSLPATPASGATVAQRRRHRRSQRSLSYGEREQGRLGRGTARLRRIALGGDRLELILRDGAGRHPRPVPIPACLAPSPTFPTFAPAYALRATAPQRAQRIGHQRAGRNKQTNQRRAGAQPTADPIRIPTGIGIAPHERTNGHTARAVHHSLRQPLRRPVPLPACSAARPPAARSRAPSLRPSTAAAHLRRQRVGAAVRPARFTRAVMICAASPAGLVGALSRPYRFARAHTRRRARLRVVRTRTGTHRSTHARTHARMQARTCARAHGGWLRDSAAPTWSALALLVLREAQLQVVVDVAHHAPQQLHRRRARVRGPVCVVPVVLIRHLREHFGRK